MRTTASRLVAAASAVSVLFNEPKLLKLLNRTDPISDPLSFSALQRAEIAEMERESATGGSRIQFQCSSTSRNC